MASNINNKRVAKNTLFLYLRTLLVMGITIYTSRVILDILGVDDYGIYNVVGGFVSMFSMLSATMTTASQRFIAYELGTEKPDVKKVFSTAVSIHILLAVVIFVLLESIGIWFLNNKMNISPERMTAANWVFQCSVITFCINLISIPYNAAIVAYEKMSTFAYISIFEVTCKLIGVYSLIIIPADSLIVYAVLMMAIAVFLRLIYGWYCSHYCSECRYPFYFDKNTFAQMFSFSGWNFIGSTAGILNGQGINILINIFFGTALNAARGIASQVEHAINTFVQNFMMALNPQITKSYASGDFAHVNSMIVVGTKVAFFLLWFFSFPVYVNTDYILGIWLKEVPDYAAIFLQMGIIYNLINALSQCLYTTMLATGNIKKYQIIVGGIGFLAFPLIYILFKLGYPPESSYWALFAVMGVGCLIARIFLLQDMVPNFRAGTFLRTVIFPISITIIPIVVISYVVHNYIKPITAWTFVGESIWLEVLSIAFIWFLALRKSERVQVKTILNKQLRKLM